MKRKSAVQIVADLTQKPLTSTNDLVPGLQEAGLMPLGVRGRNGGVDLDASHRVNLLLAAALDHPRGVAIAAGVIRYRSLPMKLAVWDAHSSEIDAESYEQNLRMAFAFVSGLMKLNDLGTALDSLLASMMSGAFAEWVDDEDARISVDFNGETDVRIMVERRKRSAAAVFEFGPHESRPRDTATVKRIVRINEQAFAHLAAEDST